MKSVLISIQPQWCELIASGIKTVEVRKTKPKIETPFKCYIYQTKHGNGKIIGEFVCDKVVEFENSWYDPAFYETAERSCLGVEDLAIYIGKKDFGYGWHISDLVIYDKPRDLSEFKRICDENCQSCKYAVWQTSAVAYEPYIVDCSPIKRPPQSWCYIEERTQK